MSGGWTYGELCPRLHADGVGARQPRLAAARQRRRRLGCLAEQIDEVELLTADGELVTLGQGDERFPAAAVSLGWLGVVTALTLRLRPAFSMVQHVHERVSLDAIARGCLHRAAHRGAVAPALAPLPGRSGSASGDELQTEYFVPWEHAPAAIATVTALGAVIRPVLLLTEIRAVAADQLWLSPSAAATRWPFTSPGATTGSTAP